MKTIDTLVQDIYDVIDGKGGWDAAVSEFFATEVQGVVGYRLTEERTGGGALRMSNLGSPCRRKLWYTVNQPSDSEVLRPPTKLKFLYGDLLEALLLSLAKAAGHRVEGCQDELSIGGVVGHRDAVIDGVTVDVKSASTFSFKKFESGGLSQDDPFGYISQLGSYVYAGRSSEVESHPSVGAFLVIDKQHGNICLDVYDFDLSKKEAEVEEVKVAVHADTPPPRAFEDEPDGASGNRKLGTNCSYCSFKNVCWPGLRTFLYSNGPRFLTEVKKVPKNKNGFIPEVT